LPEKFNDKKLILFFFSIDLKNSEIPFFDKFAQLEKLSFIQDKSGSSLLIILESSSKLLSENLCPFEKSTSKTVN